MWDSLGGCSERSCLGLTVLFGSVAYISPKTAGFLFGLSHRSICGQLGSATNQFVSFLMCCFAVIAVTVPHAVIPDKAGVELAHSKALHTQVAWAHTGSVGIGLSAQPDSTAYSSSCRAQPPHVGKGCAHCRHRSRHSAGRASASWRGLR